MKNARFRAMLAIAVLLAAQLACNMPTSGGDQPQIPAPNQTLTALFAFTPGAGGATATVTLPPVVTATAGQVSGNPTQGTVPGAATAAPGAATATTGVSQPTAAPGQPTATRAAQATIPNVRPRDAVVAKFLTTPPTLDGDWSEWKDITTEYPAAAIVYGRENWANADDLAGSFHIGWDNNYLYIAVKVRDEVYVQNATGENLFRGDSVEILLDTKLQEDFYYDAPSPDDFQLGISPGRGDVNGAKEAYLWQPTNVAGARDVRVASRLEAGVWRMEAAIPWNVFETTPTEGMHMGFAISISDNDNTGSNEQQTMVSNVSTRRLLDPTTWGDILFSR